MHVRNGLGTELDSFALVSYLSGPLAEFLDEVRHDFAPDSRAKAHVTILPPRPLFSPPGATTSAEAWSQLKERLQDFQPFRVELGAVEVFPENRVVYLSIQAGHQELKRMHEVLNTGLVAFEEPFVYHPHVTVVQELAPQDVPSAAEFARWRWSEVRHSRSFMVDRLTFVQNVPESGWTDLATHDLATQLTR
jgi:2'-5' RNA ligase